MIAFKRTTKLLNKQCLDLSRHGNHMKDKKNAVQMRECRGKIDDKVSAVRSSNALVSFFSVFAPWFLGFIFLRFLLKGTYTYSFKGLG